MPPFVGAHPVWMKAVSILGGFVCRRRKLSQLSAFASNPCTPFAPSGAGGQLNGAHALLKGAPTASDCRVFVSARRYSDPSRSRVKVSAATNETATTAERSNGRHSGEDR